MRFYPFLFLFLFSFTALFSDEPSGNNDFDIEQYTPSFDFESSPSAILGGVINVITGRYIEKEVDYVSPSANSIQVERSYNDGMKERGYLDRYWDLNIAGKMTIQIKNKKFQVIVRDRGDHLFFEGKRDSKIYLHNEVYKKGVCNSAPPMYVGLASPKIRSFFSSPEFGLYVNKWCEKSCFLLWDEDYYRYLTKVLFPTGCSHHFSYNDQYRVNRMQSLDSEGRELANIKLTEHPLKGKEKEKKLDIISDEGMTVSYCFAPFRTQGKSTRYHVSSVKTNFSPPVHYNYFSWKDSEPMIISGKYYPEERYLSLKHEKPHKKIPRVIELCAPAGCDKKPVPIYKFQYKKRRAYVSDANGNKKRYGWNKAERLTSIDHYDKWGEVYRVELIEWGAHKVNDPTFLRARHLVTPSGKVVTSKRFINDKTGNVIEEILYGNLTGNGKLRKNPDDESGEKYVKKYTYTGRLIKSETFGVDGAKFQKRINYIYYDDTKLIKMKLISDQEGVRERYYYEYASCGVPILEIVDDGYSTSIDNLDGVKQRTIKRVKLTDKGLPCEEVHAYLDLHTHNEVQLSRFVNHYSAWGRVERKDYYDTDDVFAYSEFWKYNTYGLVIEETDRMGRTTFFDYDVNGNCISKCVPHQGVETVYTYDYSNRLIKEEENHDDGRGFIKSYAYDLKGNRIREVDAQGQETLYTYDEFDRLIEKSLAPIENTDGDLVDGAEKYKYDILDHLTEKTESNGKITQIKTNFYGKPTRIQHSDKSEVRAVYYPDGSLNYTIDLKDVKTRYEYDYKNRVILEEKLTLEGELICCKSWKYDAFNLIEDVDAEGIVTTYTYDGAGRITAKRRAFEETLYFYDSWGREKEKWEKCGDSTYRVTIREYDALNQIIEERVEDESGELYLLKAFSYDSCGNLVSEAVYSQGEVQQTRSYYNSSGQLIKRITPDGGETLFHYENDYINAHGQTVKSEIVIDPKGNAVHKVYDSREKIAVEDVLNVYSESVQRAEYVYNQKGLQVLKRENVIVSGDIVRVHLTAFEYDDQGRETAVIEAKGESEQKITRRTYTAFGEVEEILRPNGSTLQHCYDFLGRLLHLTSSDSSIDYVYTYDFNDNILDVEDRVSGTHTNREYDPCGNIIAETMAHGAYMEYSYDPLSRLLEVILPDRSMINYEYDAGYLREITRGKYVHRNDYDISGRRKLSKLAGSVGTVAYTYDPCLRPETISSPYHGMEISFDSVGNVAEVDYFDDQGEVNYCYEYDDLNQITSDNSHFYQYDSLGNRVSYDGLESVHNALNQMLQQGDTQLEYDANGNLSLKNHQQYVYDALDRMTEVIEGNIKTSYSYDPFHRRLGKTRYRFEDGHWVEVSRERYLYQSDKEIGLMDEHGELQQLRVLGIGVSGEVGAAVLMELCGRTYVPLHDWRGNVTAIVDVETSEVVESYRFDAFGVESSHNPINPWRFSSKRVDCETGFSYFGARYYDPEVGRWTTPDPMWFVDGTHLYCYVRNNPALFIDPEGLFWEEIGKFLYETFKSVFEFAINYCDVDIGEHGTLQVNFGNQPRSLDHKSGIRGPSSGAYGSVHVMTINGIENSVYESADFCRYISGMADGCTSSFVYNASHRGIWDLLECVLNYVGIATRPVSLLHREWDNYFSNCPDDNGIIIMACHSQGAILTRNALASYDPELRKRIHVVAIAPGAYIDEHRCGSVLHLVSKRDIVPFFDVLGRCRNRHTTEYLDPHPSAAFFDHAAQSPTYEKRIRYQIKLITRTFGGAH